MTGDYVDIDPETGEVMEREAEVTSGPYPRTTGESTASRSTPTGLVPVPQESHTYRPSLVLAPDDARELVHQVLELQRSVLRPGIDFDKIPGTPKPTLLKPGAERLLQFFGLGHSMELLSTDTDDNGRPVGFFYRCTVTKTLTDGQVVVVSSCDGYCGRDEAKWRSAPINTILKMAQKRALVGACLTATATSGLFTQDIEDYDQAPRKERAASRPERAPDHGEGDPNLISAAQLRFLNTLLTKANIAEREDKLQFCIQQTGRKLTSSKELTKVEATKIIDLLKERLGIE